MTDNENKKPIELVVYDFDGTSITGNSPVILVRYLWNHRLLRKTVLTRIGFWALRYKFRLPQNESYVRGLVFSAFEGMPKEEADAFLVKFYEEKIEQRFRSLAQDSINRHRESGRVVWMVSATFEPIAQEACKRHNYSRQFSTRMLVDENGNYTRKVLGLPVEGEEKLRVITKAADEEFGKGNWSLEYAYGDHHSDKFMLAASKHPCAVSPDKPLKRYAKRFGWTILEWR